MYTIWFRFQTKRNGPQRHTVMHVMVPDLTEAREVYAILARQFDMISGKP